MKRKSCQFSFDRLPYQVIFEIFNFFLLRVTVNECFDEMECFGRFKTDRFVKYFASKSNVFFKKKRTKKIFQFFKCFLVSEFFSDVQRIPFLETRCLLFEGLCGRKLKSKFLERFRKLYSLGGVLCEKDDNLRILCQKRLRVFSLFYEVISRRKVEFIAICKTLRNLWMESLKPCQIDLCSVKFEVLKAFTSIGADILISESTFPDIEELVIHHSRIDCSFLYTVSTYKSLKYLEFRSCYFGKLNEEDLKITFVENIEVLLYNCKNNNGNIKKNMRDKIKVVSINYSE